MSGTRVVVKLLRKGSQQNWLELEASPCGAMTVPATYIENLSSLPFHAILITHFNHTIPFAKL